MWKKPIKISEFYDSTERFIISTKRKFQQQNNFKILRISNSSPILLTYLNEHVYWQKLRDNIQED